MLDWEPKIVGQDEYGRTNHLNRQADNREE